MTSNRVNTFTPELFRKEDSENWQAYLEEHGYVVIKKCLSNQDKIHAFSLFVEDWNTVTPRFDFHNKNTWAASNCPMMWNKGMIYWNGLGQSNFMWYLRTHQNIKNLFKILHKTDHLATSYDGFSLFLSSTQKPSMWLHTDQNPKMDVYSVQGAYNFLPVGEDDAGFMVVSGSHKTFKPEEPDYRQFIQVPDEDEHYERAVKLLIPDNCFILWNSRTIHANIGMTKRATIELNRLTTYISMFPKSLQSEEIYGARLAGYRSAQNCGHYSIYHHPKRHPYGLKQVYESRGFKWIEPKLEEDGEIPAERLELI
jgi:ectoine hydroxylase-related dioxygenase (phytanoyl-CoA dioxygenase family)